MHECAGDEWQRSLESMYRRRERPRDTEAGYGYKENAYRYSGTLFFGLDPPRTHFALSDWILRGSKIQSEEREQTPSAAKRDTVRSPAPKEPR